MNWNKYYIDQIHKNDKYLSSNSNHSMAKIMLKSWYAKIFSNYFQENSQHQEHSSAWASIISLV